jgi:hypothetical protein
MSKKEVKEVLERVLTWPEARQANLARVIELMEEQDESDLRLTDEQVAEVRQRLTEKNPKSVSLEQFNDRMRRRYGV